MSGAPLGIEPPLLARLRAAAPTIAWRPAEGAAPGRSERRRPSPEVRIAHLHDEEARVETVRRGEELTVTVDSGPVGALVLVVEAEARGPPRRIETFEAGKVPGFSAGSIRATWSRSGTSGAAVSLRELAELARYALI